MALLEMDELNNNIESEILSFRGKRRFLAGWGLVRVSNRVTSSANQNAAII